MLREPSGETRRPNGMDQSKKVTGPFRFSEVLLLCKNVLVNEVLSERWRAEIFGLLREGRCGRTRVGFREERSLGSCVREKGEETIGE